MLRGDLVVDAAPAAVAVLGHAMMVDRRTLDRRGPPGRRGLAAHLAARGIACVVADLRGHGESGPRAEDGGDWSYDDLVEHDVPALIALARDRFPSLPLACLGHSLFGHVALAHVARHPSARVDGLVLLACNVIQPEFWRRRSRRLAGRAVIGMMGAATRLFGRLPVQRFGYGSDDEPRGYVDDFVRWTRVADWQARDGFSYYGALPSLARPVCAIVGAGDRLLSPPAQARALATRIPGGVVHVVGTASGLPFDPTHMGLVLDERARPAWDLAADFILGLRVLAA